MYRVIGDYISSHILLLVSREKHISKQYVNLLHTHLIEWNIQICLRKECLSTIKQFILEINAE